jgi:ubiquinone/menaquinone biosynthesis C-methylase UbiE
MSVADTYVLGRSDAETRRLIFQHTIYGPITRGMFEAAGISAGMRVLDVGSGAGDVALLLADLVGPRGRVVGLDMNPTILHTARARVQSAGWRNVSFQAGSVWDLPHGAQFDAIVGRWILMYLPDPASVLSFLASRLRPGGIMAFQDVDFNFPPTSFPETELTRKVQKWMVPLGNTGGGPEMQMGTKLFQAFLRAGMPAPELRLQAPIGGGLDWAGYEYLAETLRSLMPALERMTGLDPDEVQIDTLAARLRADALTYNSVQMLPVIISAWARKPA